MMEEHDAAGRRRVAHVDDRGTPVRPDPEDTILEHQHLVQDRCVRRGQRLRIDPTADDRRRALVENQVDVVATVWILDHTGP
jgi:hypothetical protein